MPRRPARVISLLPLTVALGALTLASSALGTPPRHVPPIAAFFPTLSSSAAAPAAPGPRRPAPPHAPARSLDAPTTASPRPALAARAEAPRPALAALSAASCGRHFLSPFDGPLTLRGAYRSGGGPIQFCPQWSSFGLVRGPSRHHGGIDLSSPTGTSVRAATDGTIVYAREPGYGLHGRLRFSAPVRGKSGTCSGHEEYEIIYAHLIDDGKTPTATRSVRAGEMIGRVGCSGNARGMCSPSPESHLHVTVQKLRTRNRVDPGPFLGWAVASPTDHPAEWGACGRGAH